MKPLRLSLAMKLLAVLLALTVVPLVLITAVSDFVLVQAAETEASRLALGSLAQTQYLGDSITDVVMKICMATATDGRTDALATTTRLEDIHRDFEVSYQFMTYQNDLETRVKAESVVSKIKVQFRDADYSTDTLEGTYRRTDFADHSVEPSGWLPEQPLTYRYPIPGFVAKHPGWIEVSLNEVAFSRHLNPPQAAGRIAIANANGLIVSHPDKTRLGHRLEGWPAQAGPRGYRVVATPTGRVLLTRSGAGSGPWLWIGEYPLEVLTKSADARRLVTQTLALVLFAATVALSWLVSRRFFRPIRALAHKSFTGEDFQILARSFEALQTRENRLFRGSRHNDNGAYEVWLNKVLDGNTSAAPAGHAFGTHFQCALVLIDEFAAFQAQHDEGTRHALQRVLLQAIIIALEGRGLTCRVVLRGEGRLAVVLDGRPTAEAIDESVTQPLAQEVRQWLGTSLTFCFGARLSGMEGLVRSWSQAQELVELRFLQGSGRAYFFESASEPESYLPLSVAQLQRFLVCLESGNLRDLSQTFEAIAEHIRRFPGRGQYRAGLFQLASAFQTWLAENGLTEAGVFGPGGPQIFGLITASETLEAVCADLKAHCGRILEWRTTEQLQKKSHHQRVLDFLWDNYREDCDIAAVAEGVGLSYSHVRRIFAEQMGETIVAYVNRIRIDDARHLLQNTGMSLDEIAQAVGFRNTQSLHRYFRATTGTTPGEFRKSRPSRVSFPRSS